MLFIYPNGLKPTNENMLCTLFYMPFIFSYSADRRSNNKKIRPKHTHAPIIFFLFCSFFEAYTEFVGCIMYIPAFVCGMHAGNLLFIYVFFLRSNLSSDFHRCASLFSSFLLLCSSILFTMARNETRRNGMRCTEYWMQKNIRTEKT